MSIPRPLSAYLAMAAGAIMVLAAAAVALTPSTHASDAPRAAAAGVQVGAPIAYDIEERLRGGDPSVPPASSTLLPNPAGDPIPTF
jgi:hypothetical protein